MRNNLKIVLACALSVALAFGFMAFKTERAQEEPETLEEFFKAYVADGPRTVNFGLGYTHMIKAEDIKKEYLVFTKVKSTERKTEAEDKMVMPYRSIRSVIQKADGRVAVDLFFQ